MTVEIGSNENMVEFIRNYNKYFKLREAPSIKEFNFRFMCIRDPRNIFRLLRVIYLDVMENKEVLDRLTVNGYTLLSAMDQAGRNDLPKIMNAQLERTFAIEPIKYLNKF
jgi:hypothetical protein